MVNKGMERLANRVRELVDSDVSLLVEQRVREFLEVNKQDSKRWFSELAFCILTANYSAEGGIRIQREIEKCFLSCSREKLARELRRLGHRFPEARANYIVLARRYAVNLKEILLKQGSTYLMREWLVSNVKGIGYKEASHFLRNVGFFDVAILDYHILDLLEHYNIIRRPKTLTRRRYFEIENVVRELASLVNLEPGILDLYLWYMETGKVLK
ncbi:MAG: N-glycosylase/DNA lyase [Desulfurococcales archaeon]|nr:N-glycosylase/DNA lyase [Desulfurococcales archaeon]